MNWDLEVCCTTLRPCGMDIICKLVNGNVWGSADKSLAGVHMCPVVDNRCAGDRLFHSLDQANGFLNLAKRECQCTSASDEVQEDWEPRTMSTAACIGIGVWASDQGVCVGALLIHRKYFHIILSKLLWWINKSKLHSDMNAKPCKHVLGN